MRGIGLVTGDSGSGTTSACRKVVAALHTGLYRGHLRLLPRAAR
jgi:type II secretory pathway predicted ATPase ExeA